MSSGSVKFLRRVDRPLVYSPSGALALRGLICGIYLIAGTRGGLNRARIIEALHERPYNANQLSEALEIDYRTIRHHLDLLRKNGFLARPVGDAYGSPYFLSAYLEGNYAIFEEIREKLPTWER